MDFLKLKKQLNKVGSNPHFHRYIKFEIDNHFQKYDMFDLRIFQQNIIEQCMANNLLNGSFVKDFAYPFNFSDIPYENMMFFNEIAFLLVEKIKKDIVYIWAFENRVGNVFDIEINLKAKTCSLKLSKGLIGKGFFAAKSLLAQFVKAMSLLEKKKISYVDKKSASRLGFGKKKKIFEYKKLILSVDDSVIPQQDSLYSGIKHRAHLVRGHWRNYKNGKRVWVKPHGRGDVSLGMVHKDYEVC